MLSVTSLSFFSFFSSFLYYFPHTFTYMINFPSRFPLPAHLIYTGAILRYINHFSSFSAAVVVGSSRCTIISLGLATPAFYIRIARLMPPPSLPPPRGYLLMAPFLPSSPPLARLPGLTDPHRQARLYFMLLRLLS